MKSNPSVLQSLFKGSREKANGPERLLVYFYADFSFSATELLIIMRSFLQS